MLNFCQDICKVCNIYKEYEKITKCDLNQPILKSDENSSENEYSLNFRKIGDTDETTQEIIDTVQITEDGGIIKKIIKEGEGELPKKGQEIKAHDEGTLPDGSVFDSSYSSGTPFNFVLGEGKVIKAWDESFSTMKKGEQALIIAEPKYAYGDSANIPKIPPN